MTTNPATPQMRTLAARVVAHEAEIGDSAGVETLPAFRVCDKLRQPLIELAGSAGFRSLLSRALVIAQREIPSLSDVRVSAEGFLEDGMIHTQTNKDLHGKAVQNNNEQGADGGLLLVAELLGLMHIFIGEAITLRLVRDVWPNASVTVRNSEGKNKHEP